MKIVILDAKTLGDDIEFSVDIFRGRYTLFQVRLPQNPSW